MVLQTPDSMAFRTASRRLECGGLGTKRFLNPPVEDRSDVRSSHGTRWDAALMLVWWFDVILIVDAIVMLQIWINHSPMLAQFFFNSWWWEGNGEVLRMFAIMLQCCCLMFSVVLRWCCNDDWCFRWCCDDAAMMIDVVQLPSCNLHQSWHLSSSLSCICSLYFAYKFLFIVEAVGWVLFVQLLSF